jgi:hypothetical protein
MRWWKIALVISAIWIGLIIVAGILHTEVILAGQLTEAQDDVISFRYGFACGVGLVLIWAVSALPRLLPIRDTAGGPQLVTFAPCPQCSASDVRKVSFTWWGGLLGPWLFNHVKCQGCGAAYNGKSGKSNTVPITIYVVVSLIVSLIVVVALAAFLMSL